MKKLNLLALLIVITSFMVACSEDNDSDNKKGDHVWKQQTDTIQQSKDAAKKLQESLKQQQEKMEQSK